MLDALTPVELTLQSSPHLRPSIYGASLVLARLAPRLALPPPQPLRQARRALLAPRFREREANGAGIGGEHA